MTTNRTTRAALIGLAALAALGAGECQMPPSAPIPAKTAPDFVVLSRSGAGSWDMLILQHKASGECFVAGDPPGEGGGTLTWVPKAVCSGLDVVEKTSENRGVLAPNYIITDSGGTDRPGQENSTTAVTTLPWPPGQGTSSSTATSYIATIENDTGTTIRGRTFWYNPKPDVTAGEVARLLTLFGGERARVSLVINDTEVTCPGVPFFLLTDLEVQALGTAARHLSPCGVRVR